MTVSIIVGVLAAVTLPFWIRICYRMLREAPATEETGAAYARSVERTPMRESGTLNWSSAEGQTTIPMKSVNISTGGALVEAKRALSVGSVVLIHFGSLRTMTTATVRHCAPCGLRFRIGVEFRHPLIAAQQGAWKIVLQSA